MGPQSLLDHLERVAQDAPSKHRAFPVDAFPEDVQQVIFETNQSLGYPIDFVGSAMLFAASVAIGNTYVAEIKRGWQESAVLYLALVGRAGTNKSHPLSFAVDPIIQRDKQEYRQFEIQRKAYAQAVASMKRGEQPGAKPIWRKFIVSDFTPEALSELHAFNRRGLGVYVDELAGWFKNFNRYNKGNETEFWLSQWSSKPINIDRKGSDPLYITRPFISIAGTIQSGVLPELAKDGRGQNGFIDRILFALPENLEKKYWSDIELDHAHRQSWYSILSNIMDNVPQSDDCLEPIPVPLHFSRKARAALYEWQRANTDECNLSEIDAMGGVYSKMEVYAIRFSLILQILRYSCGYDDGDAIGHQAVDGAIHLAEYFKGTAERVNELIEVSSSIDAKPLDKRALYGALPDQFTTEQGMQVASEMGVAERTFKRFISDRSLFLKVSHGLNRKVSVVVK